MKAKQIYRKYKANISSGKWLKRYLAKRTCRWPKNLIELEKNMKDLDPEYSKVCDNHFWELT